MTTTHNTVFTESDLTAGAVFTHRAKGNTITITVTRPGYNVAFNVVQTSGKRLSKTCQALELVYMLTRHGFTRA